MWNISLGAIPLAPFCANTSIIMINRKNSKQQQPQKYMETAKLVYEPTPEVELSQKKCSL